MGFEDNVRQTGLKLYETAEKSKPSLFKKDFWTGKIMDLSMKNTAFKEEMFRFVDVFPYLSDQKEVARHIQEYFCRPGQDFPKSVQWGLSHVRPDSMVAKVAAGKIGKNISSMGRQFITGATIDEAAPLLKKTRKKQGAAWTVKILKEAVTSTHEEEAFLESQVQLLERYAEIARDWPALGTGEPGGLDWGVTPQVNVSLMASCLYSQYLPKSCAMDYAIDRAKERLRPIYRKALDLGAYVMVDMEHLPARKFTLELFKSINQEAEFRDWPHKGIAYQAYMKDALPLLDELMAWARNNNQDFGIRLVKGAFWDEEVVLANLYNYPIPVFTNKHATDASYERCVRVILENQEHILLKCASHNIRTVAYTLECAKELKVPKSRLEFQMLHGMAENLRRAWKDQDLNLRLYSPVGEIVPGMAYLVRRLLENTSSESFLRQSFADGQAKEALLRDPAELAGESEAGQPPDETGAPGTQHAFSNEPPVSWDTPTWAAFAAALEETRKQFPVCVSPVIDGNSCAGGVEQITKDPNDSDRMVARTEHSGPGLVDDAVSAATAAAAAWADTDPQERAGILFAAADRLRKDRHHFAALLVYETGKNWTGAQGDVSKSIDLLEFYGREMIRLSASRTLASIPGETSRSVFAPRGSGAIITSWRNALPDAVGMIAAAVVTGNAVVFKPSSRAPAAGQAVVTLFDNVGLMAGVINFLPGAGKETGRLLVRHPDVDFVGFSGTAVTGADVMKGACDTPEKPGRYKPIIARTGGKNAIIIDSDADIDAALWPVVYSALGYMGQGFSAASRLIVLENHFDTFAQRFKHAVETMIPGPADAPRTDISAVIDQEHLDRINRYIQLGMDQGRLLTRGASFKGHGTHIQPAVFTDISPDSPLAMDEIAGPVVCLFKASDFNHALALANQSNYGYTGGIFSRSPANIEHACRKFAVGTLFINQGIANAMVQRHPAAHLKGSGTGAPAMGTDYLAQFMVSRTIVENTFRSGFAPMEQETTRKDQ
jgi:RHH-type proline utilization regulon transcriptional repressor/proline dehydrogenase/delta 1-pyrroline-5-carboxylate dehydrogenase